MLLEDRLLSPWRAAVVVSTLAALSALMGVFSMPVLDRDEARFVQATSQMLETGDYVQIRFQDQPRHKKPIGIHWMQALSAGVSDAENTRSVWSFRLPSVLGAVLAALSAYWIGLRLYGRSVALYGGGLLAVSVLLGVEGGIAKTDAMLAGLTGLSLLSFIQVRLAETSRHARLWAVAMWGAVALGALVKGPITPMIAGLAVLTLCLIERRIIWLRAFFYWPGPALAALIILPWLTGVQIATDGAFLREALSGDLAPKMTSGHEGHGAPPGSYLALISVLILPAIVFLPVGVHALFQSWRKGDETALAAKLLTVMIVPGWLVFEIAPTKLPHYVLPLFPALAVVCGIGVMRWADSPRLWRAFGSLLMVMGAGAAAGVFIVLGHIFQADAVLSYMGAGLTLLSTFTVLTLMWRDLVVPALIAALITGLGWHFMGRTLIAPSAHYLFPSQQAANVISELQSLSPDADLISTYTEPSLVFLTGGDVQLTASQTLADQLTAQTLDFSMSRIYVFDMSRWADADAAALETLVTAACAVRLVDGFNYSRGTQTVLLIAATGCRDDHAQPVQE